MFKNIRFSEGRSLILFALIAMLPFVSRDLFNEMNWHFPFRNDKCSGIIVGGLIAILFFVSYLYFYRNKISHWLMVLGLCLLVFEIPYTMKYFFYVMHYRVPFDRDTWVNGFFIGSLMSSILLGQYYYRWRHRLSMPLKMMMHILVGAGLWYFYLYFSIRMYWRFPFVEMEYAGLFRFLAVFIVNLQ